MFDLPTTKDEALKGCTHVAYVTPSVSESWMQLEEAYLLTNSIDYGWWLNENVSAISERTRSSSVGDVFVFDNGDAYIVANIGFKKLI